MSEKITRMYGTRTQAMRAYTELKELGYEDVAIVPHSPPPEGGLTADSREAIVSELTGTFILKDHAKIYAERIIQGGTVVTVDALFSTALAARELMDSCEPIDSGVPEPDYSGQVWDEKLPMSSMLRMPTLSNSKLPFEDMWGVPSVVTGRKFLSEALGFALTSKSATPLSSAIGLPTISGAKTPFSSAFGLPLLSKPGPKTTSRLNLTVPKKG